MRLVADSASGRNHGSMGAFASESWPLAVLAGALVFWAWCLWDVSRTEEAEMRTLSKPVWLVVVGFGSVMGAVFWWIAGRRHP